MTDFNVNPMEPPRTLEPADTSTFRDLVKASGESESGFVGLAAIGEQAVFPAVPGYNPLNFLIDHPELDPWRDTILDAQSPAEAQDMQRRINAELENRRIREAWGWTGVGTDIVASILSPSTFVPFGAAVKGVRGVGKLAGVAAGSVALDEAVLQSQQITRTAEETAASVLGAAVIGGALGVAINVMTPAEFATAAGRIVDTEPVRMPPMPNESLGGGLSAQVVRESPFTDPGQLKGVLSREEREGAGFFAKALDSAIRFGGQTAPNMRNLMNSSSLVRAYQAKLSDSGLPFRAAEDGRATAPGQTVEVQARMMHNNYLAKGLRALEDQWTKYYHKTDEIKTGQRTTAEFGGLIRTGGRMNRADFERELFLEMNKPKEGQVPEIAAAAKQLRKEFYDPLLEELKPVLKKMVADKKIEGFDADEDINYINHVFSKDDITARPDEFKAMIIRSVQKKMQAAYLKKLQKAEEADVRATADIADLSRPIDEVRELQKDIRLAREEFEESELADFRAERTLVRAELKELRKSSDPLGDRSGTPSAKARRITQLEDRIKKLDEVLKDPDNDALLKADNELRRRSTLLSRSVARLEERQARAYASLEAEEERARNILRTVTKKAVSFQETMEGLSDEAYAAGIRSLEADFNAAADALEKIDDKIRKLEEKHPEISVGPISFEMRVQRFRREVLPAGKLVMETEADRAEVLTRLDDALMRGETFEGTPLTPPMRKSLEELREMVDSATLNDPAELQKAFDKVARAQEKAESLSAKLSEIADLLESAGDESPAFARQMLNDWYNDILDDVRDRLARQSERQARMLARTEKLDPEYARAKIRDLEEAKVRRSENLDEWVRKYAIRNGDELDFTDVGEEFASDLIARIKGDPARVVGMDLYAERGPELVRSLDIPIEEKMAFLETNVSKLMRIYASTVAPDITLYKNGFGINGAEAIAKVQEDFAKRIDTAAANFDKRIAEAKSPTAAAKLKKQKEKEMVRLDKEMRQVVNAFVGQIQRLRHQRGVAGDPDTFMHRGGRMLMQWNTLTMMGNVVVPSLVDPAGAVFKYGLKNVFHHALKPYLTNLKGIQMSKREARYALLHELTLQDRYHMLTDLVEDGVSKRTKGEKAVDFLTSKIGIVGLFSYWTQGMKEFVTPITVGKMMDALEVHETGKALYGLTPAKARQVLAEMQIDGDLAERIWAQRLTGGLIKEGDLWIPNTEAFTDAGARDAFHATILSEIDNTIITPGIGERPLFTDRNLGMKLLTQFQSFMWSSHVKFLMAGLMRRDWAVMEGVASGIPLAALSFYVDQIARGVSQEEIAGYSEERWLDEIIARSPFLGVMSQAKRYGEAQPALAPYLNFSDEGPERRWASQGLAAVAGPGYTTLNRMSKVVSEIDDPTQSTGNTIKQLTPYNNVTYLRQLFDKVVESSGLPERR